MTPNDRVALELGRALMRAVFAEAQLAALQEDAAKATEDAPETTRRDPTEAH